MWRLLVGVGVLRAHVASQKVDLRLSGAIFVCCIVGEGIQLTYHVPFFSHEFVGLEGDAARLTESL